MDPETLESKVTELTEKGKPPSRVAEFTDDCDVNGVDAEGMTPLIYVIQNEELDYNDRLEKVRLLLRRGANVNQKGEKFWNDFPIHIAVAFDHLDVLVALLDAGADVNIPCETKHQTPLHLAVDTRNAKAVELLLERGADVSSVDYAMDTPLHLAADKFNLDPKLLGNLIKHNAPLGVLDWDDNIPLLRALQPCFVKMESTIKLLLLAGSRCTRKVCDRIRYLQRSVSDSAETQTIMSMLLAHAFSPRSLQDTVCLRIRELLGGSLLRVVSELPVTESCKRQIKLSDVLEECGCI